MDYLPLMLVLIPLLLVGVIIFMMRASSNGGHLAPMIAFSVVAIVIIAAVVPIISPDVSIASSLQYDDYLPGDGIDSADGALELWEDADGGKWIHAKDVGAGSYSVKGVTHTVTVDKAPLAVFFSMGQSNGAYRLATANASEADPVAQLGTCYYFGDNQRPTNYGRYSDSLSYGMYSMTTSANTAKIGDFDEPFAASYYADSGIKTYVINACVEGTSINSWTQGGYCYAYAQKILSLGLDAIDLDHFEPVSYATLWNQGEGDGYTSVATYKSDLLSIYSDLSSGAFDASCAIDTLFIVKTRAIYTNASIAQTELANEVSGIYLASSLSDSFTVSNGRMNVDNLHYSQLGDNLLGASVADYCYRIMVRI